MANQPGHDRDARRTIVVTPTTEFVMVKRVQQSPSGYRDDFIELPLGPEGVYVSAGTKARG